MVLDRTLADAEVRGDVLTRVTGEHQIHDLPLADRQAGDTAKTSAWRENAASSIAGLTARQRQVMDLVLAGHPSKNIATDLGVSQRTVENHRAAVMKKTGSRSIAALVRLVLAAEP